MLKHLFKNLHSQSDVQWATGGPAGHKPHSLKTLGGRPERCWRALWAPCWEHPPLPSTLAATLFHRLALFASGAEKPSKRSSKPSSLCGLFHPPPFLVLSERHRKGQAGIKERPDSKHSHFLHHHTKQTKALFPLQGARMFRLNNPENWSYQTVKRIDLLNQLPLY